MKKIEFTKEYLDKIILPTETHSIEEYSDAISKLRQIMKNLNMDYYTPDYYTALGEYKDISVANQHIGRISFCTNYVIENSLEILQNNALEDKHNIEKNLKDIWHELISSFDYSSDYDINIYDICLFEQALYVFEQAVKSLMPNSK